jgi:hypothetical protein
MAALARKHGAERLAGAADQDSSQYAKVQIHRCSLSGSKPRIESGSGTPGAGVMTFNRRPLSRFLALIEQFRIIIDASPAYRLYHEIIVICAYHDNRSAVAIPSIRESVCFNFHAIITRPLAPTAAAIEFRIFIPNATIAPCSAILLRHFIKGIAEGVARPAGQGGGENNPRKREVAGATALRVALAIVGFGCDTLTERAAASGASSSAMGYSFSRSLRPPSSSLKLGL